MKKRKNPAAVSLGRLGGKVMSEAKREANRQRAVKRWEKWRQDNPDHARRGEA